MSGTPAAALLVAPDRARVWHRRLALRLAALGHPTRWRAAPAGSAAIDRWMGWEARWRAGVADGPQALAPLTPQEIAADRPAALVIGLDGAARPDPGGVALTLLYDGVAGEASAAAAVLAGRAPQIVVMREVDGERAVAIAEARPALERPHLFAASLGEIFARSESALIAALAAPRADLRPEPKPSAPTGADAARFLARGLAATLAGRWRARRLRPDHWRIGYRWIADDGVAATGAWPQGSYRWLPDDGRRFYADPFVFHHEGVAHLFCEEFPYATGKGALSHCIVDRQGRASPVVPVLEAATHLSYPQVFARDGAIWMIPESSAAGEIALYRSHAFPGGWRREARLVEGHFSDATLVEHEGRLWLFATRGGDGGSTWDQLELFSADALTGPWRPHSANPVLLDAASARPAGPFFRRGGALWRPVQDCVASYGAGLALAQVTRLDETGFEQRVATRLGPQPDWGAWGVHTLCEAGGLEAIDVKVEAARV